MEPSGSRKALGGDTDAGLGLVYVCGKQSGGKLSVVDALRGSKIRGLFAAGKEVVALTGAWEMQWGVSDSSPESMDAVYTQSVVTRGLQDVKVCQVSGGKRHCVAVSLDGQLFSWGTGCNSEYVHGELGHSSSSNARLGPRRTPTPQCRPESDSGSPRKQDLDAAIPQRVQVSNDLFFMKVACGKNHSAAVTNKGDLYTWGRNFEGQLGQTLRTLPSGLNAVVNGICAWPKYVSGFLSKPRVVDVSCGDMFTVVLLENGNIYRFGERFVGITHASREDERYSSELRLLIACGFDGAPFIGIATGSAHALAVTSSGDMFSWGLNTYGQLGLGGTPSNLIAPSRLGEDLKRVIGGCNDPKVIGNGIKWSKVFAGCNYSAALDQNNRLFTWGCNRYGNLAHDELDTCQFEPRPVSQLQDVWISSVVCGPRNLLAFAPSRVENISPMCGEVAGGYELRIRGSGFWASDNVTVRFVPLTEGCLQRGSIGEFDAQTGEVFCQVPKFAVPGEFAVEVSMNGKHFTSNGRVFTAFKRPVVVAASAVEASFTGGELLSFTMRGSLPSICQHPILRFFTCEVDATGKYVASGAGNADAFTVEGHFDENQLTISEVSEDSEPNVADAHLLRLLTPPIPRADAPQPFTLEISYDGGLHYSLIRIQSELDVQHTATPNKTLAPTDGQPQVYVVFFHDAEIVRIQPNSFIVPITSQRVEIECSQEIPLGVIQAESLSVSIMRSEPGPKPGDAPTAVITAIVPIENVIANRIIGTIPPLSEWEYKSDTSASTKPKNGRRPSRALQGASSSEWWKMHSKAGFFSVEVRVSMNGGRSWLSSALPFANQLHVLVGTIGAPLSIFPNLGIQSGGTQVSVSGDFLHFDTQDVVVCLRSGRGESRIRAVCVCPDSLASAAPTAMDRRLVFTAPPMLPPLPVVVSDDPEGSIDPQSPGIDDPDEVEVLVALDGQHFSESGPRFAYYTAPEVLSVSPDTARAGDKVSLSVENLVASTCACVKLVTEDLSIVRSSSLCFSLCV